jgi:DNA polymerase-3 subunit alpha
VLAALDAAISAGQQRQRAAARGQMGLFDMGGATTAPRTVALSEAPDLPRRQLLTWEKELIGTFLSDHPLTEIFENGAADGHAEVVTLEGRTPGTQVRVIGLVTGVRRIATRNNRTMAVVELEDLTGTIELVAFPDCYEQHGALFEEDAILEVVAKVDRRNDQLQLICERATQDISLRPRRKLTPRTLHLRLPLSPDVWEDIRLMQTVDDILKRHEGEDAVVIHVQTVATPVRLRSRSLRVEWSDALAGELGGVLGPNLFEIEEPRLAS